MTNAEEIMGAEHEAEVQKQRDIFSLHRYFIWCDRMRVHFDRVLEEHGSDGGPSPHGDFDKLLYMSYWYGGLYVVVEGWQKLGLADPDVDRLLASPNVDLLRRYRNGAFHYQSDYFDRRFQEFIEQQASAFWVRKLRDALSSFFLEWARRQRENASSLDTHAD